MNEFAADRRADRRRSRDRARAQRAPRTIPTGRSACSPPPAPAASATSSCARSARSCARASVSRSIIENRPGGMQNVGARACAEAPPDGYTICIINADPLVYNQFLLKKHAVRSRDGIAADRQPVPSDPDAGGEFRARGEDGRRAGRAVEGEARHAELPHRRRRRWCSTWRSLKKRARAPTGCACRSVAAARRSTRS